MAVPERPYFPEIRATRNNSRLVTAQSRRRQPRAFSGWGEQRFPFLLLRLRFLIYDRGRWNMMISAHTVTLLHNGLRDFIGQKLAIFPVPRFAAFRSVAQITTFHQYRRIKRFAHHAKIGGVHAAINRSV